MNWSLGWHQDRTIVVEARAPARGFGRWTVKAGLIQVEPPFALLERMVTLRVHLDPIDDTNAPLRVVPGSHSIGKVAEAGPPLCRASGRAHLPCGARRRLAVRHDHSAWLPGRQSAATPAGVAGGLCERGPTGAAAMGSYLTQSQTFRWAQPLPAAGHSFIAKDGHNSETNSLVES